MAAVTVFQGENTLVPEGTSHEYSCTLAEANGTAIQLAAITAVTGWLDDVLTNTTINGRQAVNLKDTGGGTLADAGSGVGLFTWVLGAADAAIVSPQPPRTSAVDDQTEQHRLTLKFAYTRVGGGAGALTHEVLYRVRRMARI
jgi:hypothetical protein